MILNVGVRICLNILHFLGRVETKPKNSFEVFTADFLQSITSFAVLHIVVYLLSCEV